MYVRLVLLCGWAGAPMASTHGRPRHLTALCPRAISTTTTATTTTSTINNKQQATGNRQQATGNRRQTTSDR